jgi:CRISPR system Cascade subunit CasC
MNTNRLYVDFHILQTVPPSCVNRDDTGRPKTAIYGGAVRARVSSQSWKRAVREMFAEMYADENPSYRTKYVASLIAKALQKKCPELDDAKAEKKAVEVLNAAGVKVNEKKKNATGALFFISSVQIEALAELAAAGEKDKTVCQKALNDHPAVDIALFGRMVADDPTLNNDASCQVAHSISTHRVQNEYDYFTAVDDCSSEDNAGAGHLGTLEFNSSTLYRYATINVTDLKAQIQEDTAMAVRNFAEAFIRSMPTGKQNSYANLTLPDLVYVTIRRDQPVNLCGAFEKPVTGKEGYAEPSKQILAEYAEKVYEDYCGQPAKSFVIGETFADAEKLNISDLLDALQTAIANEVV